MKWINISEQISGFCIHLKKFRFLWSCLNFRGNGTVSVDFNFLAVNRFNLYADRTFNSCYSMVTKKSTTIMPSKILLVPQQQEQAQLQSVSFMKYWDLTYSAIVGTASNVVALVINAQLVHCRCVLKIEAHIINEFYNSTQSIQLKIQCMVFNYCA